MERDGNILTIIIVNNVRGHLRRTTIVVNATDNPRVVDEKILEAERQLDLYPSSLPKEQ